MIMLTNTTSKNGNEGPIRTRFAPSPTGYLHIGSLRTALYSFLFARHHKGEFFFRIEDTDQSRYVPGAEKMIQETLRWAGLDWDNTEIIFQSQRIAIYREYADRLLSEKKAYHCFCTKEELEIMREEQQSQKIAPKYDRRCLTLSSEEVQKRVNGGMPYVIRFRVPDDEVKVIEYTDAIRGHVSFRVDTIDDQVLIKSDGFPTYHLASVVDDYESAITHVIRGEEWLPSTPKHIFLYRAFGLKEPVFAHLPLLLNSDKSKLSKRQGDVSVEEYREKGYVQEAILNFVALLGWNPGKGSEQEIFSLEELIERFSLEQVHKAGAVFDEKRLDWMNGEYIKRMSVDQLFARALPFIIKNGRRLRENKGEEEMFWRRVLTVEQDRLDRLDQVGERNLFFFEILPYEKNLLQWKDMTDDRIERNLKRAQDIFEALLVEEWTRENIGSILLAEAGDKRGEFLWPLRVALTGVKQSPPPQDVAWVIGKEETLHRIYKALEMV